PSGESTRGLTRATLILCYAAGSIAAVVGMTATVLIATAGPAATIAWLHVAAPLYALRWPCILGPFAISLIGMVVVLWRNYRRVDDEQQRRRIRWLVVGFTL